MKKKHAHLTIFFYYCLWRNLLNSLHVRNAAAVVYGHECFDCFVSQVYSILTTWWKLIWFMSDHKTSSFNRFNELSHNGRVGHEQPSAVLYWYHLNRSLLLSLVFHSSLKQSILLWILFPLCEKRTAVNMQ